MFNTAGTSPKIAMSSGKVFAAWNTPGVPSRVFAAERSTASGSVWTGTTVSPGSPVDHLVLAVSGFGGKATTLLWERGRPPTEVNRVDARTQTERVVSNRWTLWHQPAGRR